MDSKLLSRRSGRVARCLLPKMSKLVASLMASLKLRGAEMERFCGVLYLKLFPRFPEAGLYLPTVAPAALEQRRESLELPWGGILWAVPKKRTSYTKKRLRNAHKYLKPRCDFVACPKCKNLKLIHVLCRHCLKQTLQTTASMRRKELVKL